MNQYPNLTNQTFAFDMGGYSLAFTARNGNFSDVRVSFGEDADVSREHSHTVGEDAIEYWECCVLYYSEMEHDFPGFSLADVFRAAQVCKYLGVIPCTPELCRLIGFSSSHTALPDPWGVVRERLLLEHPGVADINGVYTSKCVAGKCACDFTVCEGAD